MWNTDEGKSHVVSSEMCLSFKVKFFCVNQILVEHDKTKTILSEALRALIGDSFTYLHHYVPRLKPLPIINYILVVTIDDKHRRLFGKERCCDEIAELLQRFYKDVILADLLIISIRCLLYRNTPNKQRFLELDVCSQIEDTMRFWANEQIGAKIRYEGRDTLARFESTCC